MGFGAHIVRILVVLNASQGGAPLCGGTAAESGVTTPDSAGITIVQNWAAARPVRQVESRAAVSIGTGPDSNHVFVSVLGAFRLNGGEMVVADERARNIVVYDAGGKFLRRIGRLGQGPGEFQSISYFDKLGGDTIVVYDGTSRRMTLMSLSGTVHRTIANVGGITSYSGRGVAIQSFLTPVGRFTDGSFLTYRTSRQSLGSGRTAERTILRDSMAVQRLSADGMRFETVLEVPWQSRLEVALPALDIRAVGPLPFSPITSLALSGNRLVLSRGAAYELEFWATPDRPARLIRVCSSPPILGEDEKAAFREARVAGYTGSGLAIQQKFANEAPYPRLVPAYVGLLATRAGGLWAMRYSNRSAPAAWDVFDFQGRFLHTVTVPASVMPLEVGEDYFLGRFVDVDGVHSVRLYRLLPM